MREKNSLLYLLQKRANIHYSSHCPDPMSEQKQKILEVYAQWTQQTKQLDDILIIGVQV